MGTKTMKPPSHLIEKIGKSKPDMHLIAISNVNHFKFSNQTESSNFQLTFLAVKGIHRSLMLCEGTQFKDLSSHTQ